MRRSTPYLWAAVLSWLVPIGLVALGWLVLPHHVSGGQCEGIGFGCVPAPADGLVIVAALYGVPVCAGLTLLSLAGVFVVRLVLATRARRNAGPDAGPDAGPGDRPSTPGTTWRPNAP